MFVDTIPWIPPVLPRTTEISGETSVSFVAKREAIEKLLEAARAGC
jgi:hypothetical protein